MATTYWAFPTQTFTAWDTNGDPVSGAKASIFEAGTSTPLVVYTDTALTTPHATPIVADANGVFAPMYISGPDEIKIDVTDTDDVQLPGYPVDNITGIPIGGLTASGTVYTPTATLPQSDVQAAINTLDTLTQRTKNRLIEAETAGTSNAYTLDALGTITSYADGDIFVLRADRNTSGAATLNIDNVGAKDWKRHDGSSYVAYASDEIRDGNHYWVEYDSGADELRTIFEMRRPATQAEAEAGTAVAVDMDALRVKQAIVALETTAATTRYTKITTTSGTAHGWTGIPAGTNKIVLMFSGVGLSGTERIHAELGTSGGYVTSGYDSRASEGSNGTALTVGFVLHRKTASDFSGAIVFTRLDGNEWVSHGDLAVDGAGSETMNMSGGNVTLSGELDRIQITRVGTDTFDAGAANILTEI